MKECPQCHRQYADTQNFCTVDGYQLVDAVQPTASEQTTSSSDANSSQSTGSTGTANGQSGPTTGTASPNPRPQQKTGCLKKILIAAVVVVIGFVALYNYLKNAATYLRVEPSELVATKSGGTAKVDIDYDGYFWTINHRPDWLLIEESDSSFNLTATANTTGQAREGSITIQSGKLIAQVVVRQSGVATRLTTSKSSLKASRDGLSTDITVETDGCHWETEHSDWIEVTADGTSKLTVNCPVNSGDYRTGFVRVKEDNVYATITVTQGGKCNLCHGAGSSTCQVCYGMGGSGFGMYYSGCFACGGSGKIPCGFCSGSGYKE